MLVIIDHGFGNIESVYSALKYLKATVKISNKARDIKKSKALILPGVGNYGAAVQSLKKKNLFKVINEEVLKNKKKILGICLGYQLMLESSEESPDIKGFGWIKGSVKKFPYIKKFPVPHVGWNQVKFNNSRKATMYFNHSFFTDIREKKYITSKTKYGKINFASSYHNKNIFGIQPHPEKSQDSGLNYLKYFLTSI